MNILIVGGTGGIGKALIKCLLQTYPEARITATSNSSLESITDSRVTWHKLNITNEQEIKHLADAIGPVNILINAVGVLHIDSMMPEKTLARFDMKFFQENFQVNTLSSILLAKYFLPALRQMENSHFIAHSAKVGSISDNHLGGWISYRTSKAALNMAMKTISIEWKHKVPNCCVLLFHPGTTDTALSKPFQKNLPEGQLHSADFTAQSLLRIIQTTGPKDSGRFISYDGSDIPW